MSEQITKKQHYVPQFYLKRFAETDNFIQYLDIRNMRLGKNPYPAVCYEEYYYAQTTGEQDQISQKYEEYFKLLESRIANEMEETCSIIRDVNRHVTDKERDVISYLMSMIYLRGKYMRSQIQHVMGEVGNKMVEVIKTRREPTEEEKKMYLESDNTLHLLMLKDIHDIRTWFFIKKWKAYISRGQYSFITTDNPVSEIFPQRTSLYGAHICERTHYLAIAPDILIELTKPMGNRKIKRESILPSNERKILGLNLICAKQAEQYVYSKSKGELDAIMSNVTTTH